MEQTIEKICLTDLIENRIFITDSNLPKEQIAGQLVKLICQADSRLVFKDVLQQILNREAELSTTLDSGLSIPHARLESFDRALAALAILHKPLQEINGQTVKAIFLFITPVRSDFFQTHLRILSTAVEILSPTIMDKLSVCTSPESVLEQLAGVDVSREMV